MYMCHTWLWSIDYIPAGCTGIWQPCDVGIQQPFKLTIEQAQVEDAMAGTTAFLESGGNALDFKLDATLPTLRALTQADRLISDFTRNL